MGAVLNPAGVCITRKEFDMPIGGMPSAAAALRFWERRQAVAANNMANMETHGFKGERVFARMIDAPLPVADAVTDFTVGSLTPTGNPLDLALDRDGFFVVRTQNGDRYTRGGSFHLDAAGRIADASGNLLLDEDRRPIQVPEGANLQIDREGVVRMDAQLVGRLRMERPPQGVAPAHEGDNLFVPPQGGQVLPRESRIIRQGFLEESNVGTIDSMVDMISIQRAYAQVQKTIVVMDEVRRTISNDIGRPI